MAGNWTIEEASAGLASLLEAARTATQYIVDGHDSFSVSIVRSGRYLDNLLDSEGPLRPEDVEDIWPVGNADRTHLREKSIMSRLAS
ncbi:hypothetical protein [Agrobacterium rosae]|uniref:Uncharacterized protein n=1 Tax=Agrobacterium rosae TaxID=1972867 RepID=A0AAW9FJ40_9HYPH|nr:hypothetical protein [Agrobacterium rosae]MDX8305721.1 hypothetical protein [Agrobacterium rosae]